MSKIIVVMKREFGEFVQSKTFVIATLLGPVLIGGFLALEVFIMSKAGGGDYTIAIVDQTQEGVGDKAAQLLPELAKRLSFGKPLTYKATVITQPENLAAVRDSLEKRVVADSLSGYLILPPGVTENDTARYYGSNASSQIVTASIRGALNQAVQSTRLQSEGIDPVKLATALRPVDLRSEKTGARGVSGSAEGGQIIGMLMGFAIYLAVLLYGGAIMNGVLEEKRDKIVEVIVSSLRARELMIGKVLGIGAAGLLQMLVWVASVALVLTYAGSIAAILGKGNPQTIAAVTEMVPKVPMSVGIIFLLFFTGGFFIYSTLFATVGSIATTNQEAQQLMFPAMMPIILGFFMSITAMENPDSSMAVISSMFPLTAPFVMPVRAAAGAVGIATVALSVALMIVTGVLLLYLAGKIYRVGIFATGKKPTMRELARWLRAS